MGNEYPSVPVLFEQQKAVNGKRYGDLAALSFYIFGKKTLLARGAILTWSLIPFLRKIMNRLYQISYLREQPHSASQHFHQNFLYPYFYPNPLMPTQELGGTPMHIFRFWLDSSHFHLGVITVFIRHRLPTHQMETFIRRHRPIEERGMPTLFKQATLEQQSKGLLKLQRRKPVLVVQNSRPERVQAA